MLRTFAGGSLLFALAALSGCGTNPGSQQQVTGSPIPAVKANGAVYGGQQPVTDSTIQLWAVGTAGFGSAGTALLTTPVTTSDGTGVVNSNANTGNANNTLAAGSFTITGLFSCPTAGTLVYLTSTGGNPGLGGSVNNSAIAMVAPLGQCGNLNSSTYVILNEVVTAAAVESLASFMSASGSIGSPSDSASLQGISNAFAGVNTMVSISGGAALTGFPKLNTLANALVPCVNSTGPTSSDCSALFADTTPSGGSAPTTMLGAILNIALTPTLNTTAIFNLSTANAPFQTALSSAPSLWTIGTSGAAKSACGAGSAGDTVSGTVTYSGAATGRIYLAVYSTSGCDVGTQGTSLAVTAPGSYPYTIHGVPAGSGYVVTGFLDTLGYGANNAADPTGSTTSFGVGAANVTAPSLTLSDPATVTLTSAPTINLAGGANSSAVVLFNPIQNSNGIEAATSYTLQWSTSSSFTSVAGSKSFPAGGKGTNVWIVTGLSDSSVLYFRAYGSSAGTPAGPTSSVYGPVTIGAPSSGNNVMGSITYTGTATGPLYAGFYNQDSSSVAPYVQYLPSPMSGQTFSVNVPTSSSAVYIPIAIIDQNNDGIVDWGDITNTNFQGSPIAVTGALSNQNLTLPGGNSLVNVITQHFLSGSSNTYGLYFVVDWARKLPVQVTLYNSYSADGANIDSGPMDIANCAVPNTGCSSGQQNYQIFFNLGTTAPSTGDTYIFKVTYSDGTSEMLTAEVSNVLSAFATNLVTQTTGGTATPTTPTFTWNASSCSTCTYEFYLDDNNNNTIWEVPGTGNGLPPGTTSLGWNADPTDPSNSPGVGSLSTSITYSWSVTVQDGNYNQAIATVSYTP